MQALIEGIGWGLFLTVLVGPIFFALIQAGIEYGFRAGVALGLGIWISDILFVAAMLYGITYIQEVVALDGFERWVGLIGGLILIFFGIGTFVSKPPQISFEGQLEIKKKNPYLALFSKGFLVNTINPFTFGFWLGIMGTISGKEAWGKPEYWLFFGAIIGTIVITDSLKVLGAKQIRKKLKQKHLVTTRKATGIILFVFGVVLIIRTWLL